MFRKHDFINKATKNNAILMRILGIYIPTYNRAEELRECLNSFITQVSKYKYPIYISDDCSTDNTRETISELKKRYRYIYYKKNAKNLGYAQNVAKVLSMGNTKFAWLFGDDDAINPDAIDIITKNLKQGYDFLLINFQTYSKDLKNRIDKQTGQIHDTSFRPGEHEKVILHRYWGFMASMILKKEIIDKELARLDPSAPEYGLYPLYNLL